MRTARTWLRLLPWAIIAAMASGCGSAPERPNVSAAPAAVAAASVEAPLTETDVLGFDSAQSISEEEISKAASARGKNAVKRGAAIMLIEAGAASPDETMRREAAASFAVTPFSGFAQRRNSAGESLNLSRALRLTAARGGSDFLVVYWSTVEGAVAAKGVATWRAIGAEIPLEAEQVRLRMRMLIVDVKTGQWATANPETLEEKSARGGWFRKPTSATRIAALKERAYKHALQEMLRVSL